MIFKGFNDLSKQYSPRLVRDFQISRKVQKSRLPLPQTQLKP